MIWAASLSISRRTRGGEGESRRLNGKGEHPITIIVDAIAPLHPKASKAPPNPHQPDPKGLMETLPIPDPCFFVSCIVRSRENLRSVR
jgi:hypothetical protein